MKNLKNILRNAKNSFDSPIEKLSNENLRYITGGGASLGVAGGGTSSSDGQDSFSCCDGTCVCKPIIELPKAAQDAIAKTAAGVETGDGFVNNPNNIGAA